MVNRTAMTIFGHNIGVIMHVYSIISKGRRETWMNQKMNGDEHNEKKES